MSSFDFDKVDMNTVLGQGDEDPNKLQLTTTLEQAFDKNPDEEMKKREIADALGTTPDVVDVDPVAAKSKFNFDKVDVEGITKDKPKTTKFFTQPDNALVAHDDIDVLGSIEGALSDAGEFTSELIEDTGSSFKHGQAMVSLSDLGRRDMFAALSGGNLEEGDLAQQLELRHLMEQAGEDDRDFFSGIITTTAEQLPIMFDITKWGLGGAAVGGGAGFIAGLLTGPGSIFTGFGGAKLGGRVGVAAGAFNLESGLAFDEFAQLQDEAGNNIDRELAAYAAVGVGGINAALEAASLLAIGRTVTPAMRAVIRGRFKKALGTETGRQALRDIATRYGFGALAEGGTEGLQELTNVIGAEFLKAADDEAFNSQSLGDAIDNILSVDTVERVGGSIEKGVQAGLGLGAPGTVASVYMRNRQKQLINSNDQVKLDSVISEAEKSKLRERNSTLFKQFVEEADGNDTHVFIDPVQASLYLDTHTAEEIQADPVLKMLAEKVADAAQTGADIDVPLSDVAGDMVGTEHLGALRESMTLKADAVSPMAEKREGLATFNDYASRLIAEAEVHSSDYAEAQEGFESIKGQIVDTGQMSPQEAGVVAKLWPAWATVYAQRNGITIGEAFERGGLRVTGPQTGKLAKLSPQALTQPTETTASFLDPVPPVRASTPAFNNKPVRPEAVTVVGVHYGNVAGLDSLDTSFAGTGTRGEERRRGGPKKRVNFYVQQDPAQLPEKEAVVKATNPYRVKLTNIYDSDADPLGLREKAKTQAGVFDGAQFETLVQQAGFDGFVAKPSHTIPSPAVVVFDVDSVPVEDVSDGNLTDQQSQAEAQSVPDGDGVPGSGGVLETPEQQPARSTREADGSLRGLPRIANAAVNELAVKIAQRYAKKAGIKYDAPNIYSLVNVERAERIAQAYEDMKHDPTNPGVKAAYDAMIAETLEQYQVLIQSGIKIEFIKGEDPYGSNPRKMIEDVEQNNHMWVFSTRDGFGSNDAFDPVDNPLLAETEFQISGETALVNDIFRVVHDYFGHVKEGVGFRATGEENAWRAHWAMYSPLARKAMTTETRGQNSWVNYGPHGETNRSASSEETHYADQKIGLLPDWVVNEGATDADVEQAPREEGDKPLKQTVSLRSGTETLKRFGLDPSKRWKTRQVAAALEARQRHKFGMIDPKDRSPEASRRIADWMVQEVLFELDHPESSGAGWYGEKFQNALDVFAQEFPELGTDQDARDVLTLLIAITSDGQKVVPNFAQAIEIYESYRDTGKFTSKRGTQRQSSVDNNLSILQELVDERGLEATREYLMEEMSVRDLKRIAKEQGVKFDTKYGVDVVLPRGALVLGPKLGAFYANLMGAHGYLTMDRWWSRTFNRYRGTLLASANGTQDRPNDSQGNLIGLARFKNLVGQPELSDDEALSLAVDHRNEYAARKWKDGSEIEKAANTIYKDAFENLEDTPFGVTDRSFMIEAVEKAVKTLQRKGHDVSVADVQAILWYYEKRLYGELGARQTADISYEEAANRIISDRSGRSNTQSQLEQTVPVGEEEFGSRSARGKTKGTYDPATRIINLTKASDLSTFLHEFAHFMYEMEREAGGPMTDRIHNWFKRNVDAVIKEAAEGDDGAVVTQQDVDNYLDLGTSHDGAKDVAIRRAVHEQFARGFETYIMEGKAPSIELRNAFATFARWLVAVYRKINGDLNVQLDDGARKFFDMLLATEEQIELAQVRNQIEPMFTDAAMAGMTEEEFAKYKARAEKTKDKAHEKLRDKLIKQLRRETLGWWLTERGDLVEEKLQALKGTRVYKAMEILRGEELKLDRAAVRDMVGEEKTDKLGRKSVRMPQVLNGMTAQGGEGVHPDEAAGFLGYASGQELLDDMANAPDINELATEQAEQLMKERHGDILNDGSIEAEADEAVQNEERGKTILAELKALSKKTSQAAITRQALKQMAADRIGRLTFRQIHPEKYRKAEIKAAQEAAVLMKDGDTEGAARAKARQAMNHYLAVEATAARSETTKIVDGMGRYNKKAVREAIQRAENEYWEQIVKILSRFEFRKSASLKSVEVANATGISLWADKQVNDHGDGLVISAFVQQETNVMHWKNVPYSELLGIRDTVKNIEHVARFANKITRLQEEMDFAKLVQRVVDHINKVPDSFKPGQRTDVAKGGTAEQIAKASRWSMSQMTKIPWMASWLDGGERVGFMHDVMVQPLNDAYDAEAQMFWKVAGPIVEMLNNRDKETLKRHNRKLYIPEIRDANNDGHLMGHQVLAFALNVGNQSNLEKLLLGEGFAAKDGDPADLSIENHKLQAVLKHMTKEDWELVQSIWDQMELLYPQLAEVHRKATGLTPPKVEATPVETQFGTFTGGYYPVKYDPNRDARAKENEDKLNEQTTSMFFGQASLQASVSAGATNERTGYYAPIRLSLDVVPNHFQETIHYITHHGAVRELNKLIRNQQVADAIKAKLGKDEYAQLLPWLNDIAKDGRDAPTKNFIDRMLQRLRFGYTLTIMGFRASTGLIQISGLSNTMGEVGFRHTMGALRTILGSPTTMQSAWQFAVDNSKIMQHRMDTMDREIRNAMKRLEGKSGFLAAVQETSMKHIALIQTYTVDLPTWHAAYAKEMELSGDQDKAFKHGDWAVTQLQGSGLTKDMPALLRNQSEALRMMTMFMTFFSSLWNMERDLVRGARQGYHSKTSIAAKLLFYFTIPTVFEMAMRGEFNDDDEDLDDKLIKTVVNTAIFPIQAIPFVRDVVSATAADYGYNMSPLASLLDRGIAGTQALIEAPLTDKELSKAAAKNSSKLIGSLVGAPGVNQFWATSEHIYDVLEEGEDLSLRQLMIGPDRN